MHMQLAIYVVLATIIAIVAIDSICRLDHHRQPPKPRDEATISTQEIVVDRSDRHGH
jgi:hypothetical protein